MNTKERLFETALDLFSEKGFNETSVRDITHETGLAVSSFYNHFKSKDELLQSVYDHYTSLYIGAEYTEPDYGRLLALPGLRDIFSALTEVLAESIRNEKLMKLARIITMEQYTSKTAGGIAFRDRNRMLSSMETFFALMAEKGLIHVREPRYMGRLMGYVYLGLAADAVYYYFLDNKDPEEIVRIQLAEVEMFLQKFLAHLPEGA